MKFMGFLLLVAGWAIVLGAMVILPGGTPRAVFVLAGAGVEAVGLGLAIRAHAVSKGAFR